MECRQELHAPSLHSAAAQTQDNNMRQAHLPVIAGHASGMRHSGDRMRPMQRRIRLRRARPAPSGPFGAACQRDELAAPLSAESTS